MTEKDQRNVHSFVGLSCNFHTEGSFYFIQIRGCIQVGVNVL